MRLGQSTPSRNQAPTPTRITMAVINDAMIRYLVGMPGGYT